MVGNSPLPMKFLLITPPMTQINSPYPATPYLTAFLKSLGHDVFQIDMGLELVLRLFRPEGLESLRSELLKKNQTHDSVLFFLEAFEDYKNTISPVLRFLQGKDSSLALRLANRNLVPEGPRFLALGEHQVLLSQFGEMGLQDRAKYIGSLYLDDLADVIKYGIDPHFEFSRYAESLSSSATSFQLLYDKLKGPPTLIDQIYEDILIEKAVSQKPDILGLTVPFPGNVYGALKASEILKKHKPDLSSIMGGGFVNTELRHTKDPRLFEFIDYLTFDDGEGPLESLIEFLSQKSDEESLLRVKFLKQGQIVDSKKQDHIERSFKKSLAPDYSNLPLTDYISMVEMPNPMHRMWSDFRWNKLILAHGCYWKKCTFCDTNLDYISRFEPQKASRLVDQIESIISQTGSTGFHFVDEAAPPALLKQLSEEIIKRKLKISWWGNLRFDRLFDLELAQLMADAGCVAVTGGLEVANPRLLKLINKGIDVEGAARVTRNFKKAGIYVHAYLMYGFPSQTLQETIDSLEVVRQLFASGCLDSAYWHRFMTTLHSPVGKNPDQFGIQLIPQEIPQDGLFAQYEIPFLDSVKVDHGRYAFGLKKALYNYMHQVGLEEPLQFWFEEKVPTTKVPRDSIQKFLRF